MTMTDLTALPLPDACTRWARSADPHAVIHQHSIQVNLTWWNALLARHGLAATVTGKDRTGASAREGRAAISRGDLFHSAEGAHLPETAVPLLWQTLAWGSGNKVRLNAKRVAAVAANPTTIAAALADAARAARTDPATAYAILNPNRKPVVPYLGPAFFTKFLYFAGCGEARHPCLILDSRVAAALNHAGWASLKTSGGWPPATYQRYCDLVGRWSEQVGARRDMIERWLFDTAA